MWLTSHNQTVCVCTAVITELMPPGKTSSFNVVMLSFATFGVLLVVCDLAFRVDFQRQLRGLRDHVHNNVYCKAGDDMRMRIRREEEEEEERYYRHIMEENQRAA
jgi:hypothetical protein